MPAQTDDAQRALPARADGQSPRGHHRGPVPGLPARVLWHSVRGRRDQGADVGGDGVEGGWRRSAHVGGPKGKTMDDEVPMLRIDPAEPFGLK